ncbi:Tetratricopeptide-like helical domain [Trinorchestia longiramus]|nr:Tetratricopeptide-like helical domain [Trinorchestia longiramus]
MEQIDILKLRVSVKNYIQRHHFEAAEFWGDKVVSLTEGNPTDVYWLAQTFVLTQQYHRACLLINKYNLTSNGSLCYLAALCYFKMSENERALDLLESNIWPNCTEEAVGPNNRRVHPGGGFSLPVPELDDVVSLECSRQVLRAKIYEAIDNSSLASECYQAALKADPLCYDALKALTDHHMLTVKEKKEMHASLPFGPHCDSASLRDLVRVSYDTKLNKGCVVVPGTDSTDFMSDSLPPHLSCLSNNLDVLAARAERLYYKCHFVSCFQLTKRVLEEDPYHTDCLPVHIACLIELQQSNSLFLLAHKLVDLYPEMALSWFAVGCYYYLIGKNEPARRYLSKAASIDKVFGPAWIAFAHSFAAENEHDQASAAYFKAAHLMKGSHLPLLYIGMEYSLSNNPKFALNFFEKAIEMAPDDPFVLHELGVVNFNSQQYQQAEPYFLKAAQVVQSLYLESNDCYNIPAKWTILFNNLAHTLRKLNKLKMALHYHYQAVMLQPCEASSFTGIALCQALLGNLEDAIEALHKSLSIQRDQTVAITLLTTLMEQMASSDAVFPEVADEVVGPTNNLDDCTLGGSVAVEKPVSYGITHQPTSSLTSLPHASEMECSGDPASKDVSVDQSLLSINEPEVSVSPSAAFAQPLDSTDRSLHSLEDMVMDDDSD